jgi:hypothetical protein
MGRLLPRRKLLLVPILAALLVTGGNLVSTALRLDYHGTLDHSHNVFAYQQNRLRADVLLFGSSHTRDGIIANQLVEDLAARGQPGVEVFDLSQPGGSLITTAITLRKVIASNGCPALIAAEVSPANLNKVRNRDYLPPSQAGLAELPLLLPGFSQADALNDYMGSQLHGLQQLFERLAHPPERDLIADALAKRGSFHAGGALEPRHQRALSPGWVRRGRDFYFHRYWADYTIGVSQTRALERVLALAKGCSAELVLYRMPNLAMYHPDDIESVETPYANLIESFAADNAVAYANLQWVDLGLRRRHFKNAGHLNALGANIATRYLAQHWIAPTLEGQ